MDSNSKYPKFNESKTTEAAVILLKMSGGRMSYIRLLKLLYLSDRKAYFELGRSITNDLYYSMKYGQVPSRAYDLIKCTASTTENVWCDFITPPINKKYIELIDNHKDLKVLTEAEINIIRSISMEHVEKDDFELADITKGPEYVDVQKLGVRRVATPIENILSALKYTADQVESIKTSLIEEAEIKAFFGG